MTGNPSSTFIPMPQSPAIDLRTGYPTMEWYRYWEQPAFSSITITGTLPVASGGTGISSGTSGGVLGFIGPTTIASSGVLGKYEIVFGGGPGGLPSTPIGLGDTNLVLHGNSNGYPSWGKINLATDVTGSFGVPQGGTGLTSGATGSLLYFNSTYSIATLLPGPNNYVLTMNAGIPAWEKPQIDLATLWIFA
jgi:hypothetical protein